MTVKSQDRAEERSEFFETLYRGFNTHIMTPYPEQEESTKEQILAMTYDRIKELEAENEKIKEMMAKDWAIMTEEQKKYLYPLK